MKFVIIIIIPKVQDKRAGKNWNYRLAFVSSMHSEGAIMLQFTSMCVRIHIVYVHIYYSD